MSREEIIAIAEAAVAEQPWYSPTRWAPYYDEGNEGLEYFFVEPEVKNGIWIWPEGKDKERMHEAGMRKAWPHLIGRDYQVVVFEPRDPVAVGRQCYVFIDRKTGEILQVYQ